MRSVIHPQSAKHSARDPYSIPHSELRVTALLLLPYLPVVERHQEQAATVRADFRDFRRQALWRRWRGFDPCLCLLLVQQLGRHSEIGRFGSCGGRSARGVSCTCRGRRSRGSRRRSRNCRGGGDCRGGGGSDRSGRRGRWGCNWGGRGGRGPGSAQLFVVTGQARCVVLLRHAPTHPIQGRICSGRARDEHEPRKRDPIRESFHKIPPMRRHGRARVMDTICA